MSDLQRLLERRRMADLQRFPWVTATLALGAVVLFLAPELASAFALHRAAVENGEVLSLWSGHFTHYGAAHAWPDIIAFAVWGALVESRSRALFVGSVFGLGPLLSLAVLALHPELAEYRGLSGIDAMLLAEVFVLLVGDPSLSPARRRAILAVGLLLVGKTALDGLTGRSFWGLELGDVNIVVAAHWVGALGGVIAAGARWCTDRSRCRRSSSGPGPGHRGCMRGDASGRVATRVSGTRRRLASMNWRGEPASLRGP